MKDGAFKKMLFNQCLDNLASKGRSAAKIGGTQPTDTQHAQAKIPLNIMERLEAVSTIIGGITVPSREELDCAVEELDNCIAELSAMR